MAKTVYSFDVFDTCLTRRTVAPAGVFYDTGRRVCAKLGAAPHRTLLQDIASARLQAEKLARQQADREEITLAEIWYNLALSMGWQADESLALCELDAEEAALFPIVSIRKEIQSLRDQGHRIVFVSDMYLPTEFIYRQLRGHGFAEERDGLYISGDIGKTKATGNLFRHVMAAENVPAADMLHTGDNWKSDYIIPRQLGIHVRLFEEAKPTRAETMLSPDGDSTDAGVVAAMRAFRLGHSSENSLTINELASQFLGPFSVGFAAWVLQRAQEEGVKRLYFVSRDCQLAWRVARELSPMFGDIDCRYLYASRQALFLPSADTISQDGMPWMRRPFERPTLKNLLAKIDLTFEDVQAAFASLAGDKGELFHLRSETEWEQFWRCLNDCEVASRIHRLIVERRERALEYFKSAGLFEDISWAVVDLGWYLTCQESLWKLLKSAGWNKPMKGYYLALRNHRVGYARAGSSEALIYEPIVDPATPSELAEVFSRQTLIEHIAGCADHPSVNHYEEDGSGKMAPAFSRAIDSDSLGLCNEIHREVVSFAKQNLALAGSLRGTQVCGGILATLTAAFFRYPTRRSVAAIGELSAGADQNGVDAGAMVMPMNLRSVLVPPKQAAGFWMEGSMAMTPPNIRRLARVFQSFRRVNRHFFRN